MRSRYFCCALVVVAGAVAFGCGSTYENVQSHTASYVATKKAPTPKNANDSPLHHAMRLHPPPDPHASHGPISLTGVKPYGERFDPSGWSGTSTPPEAMAPQGVGGGPPTTPTITNEPPITTDPTTTTDDDNPYEDTPTPEPAP